jgi:drug/metabolite transporter (DMT)-like permease
MTDRQSPMTDAVAQRRQLMLSGVGSILLASVLIGAMAVCVRVASRGMPAVQITFVRFLGSLLLLVAVNGSASLRPQGTPLRALLLRGLLGSLSIILYFTAIQWAGAALATLLHCTYPVSTAIIAVVMLGEPLSLRLAIALVLNLIGVAVVVGPGAEMSSGAVFGSVCALGASLLAGGALTTARSLRAKENALLITTYFMAVGTIVTTPALLSGPPVFSASLCIALAGVVITSVIAQWLIHHGLGFTTATLGSLAAATSVVSASSFEALFLGEYPEASTLLGACVLIVAIGLAVSAGERQQLPPG